MRLSRWMSGGDLQILSTTSSHLSNTMQHVFPINILGYLCVLCNRLILVMNVFLEIVTSLFFSVNVVIPTFIFSLLHFSGCITQMFDAFNRTLTCFSTCVVFLDSSLLPTTQQCRILMKAFRNSMLKVVYMTGLTALFK